jgi:hypothetical protein
MAAEFVGFTDVRHVQQPEDSELCFPALMSAVSEADLAEAHAALQAAELSGADGSTGLFMSEVRLELADTEASIEPIDLPVDPDEALRSMDDQFKTGRAVLLMYKKYPGKPENPDNPDYHWIMLTGYAAGDEQHAPKEPIQVIDPLREETARLSRTVIKGLIIQSNDYENGGQGAYAYGLSTDSGPSHEPPRPLTIVPAYDREPEPIEGTYSATGQDKVVWPQPGAEISDPIEPVEPEPTEPAPDAQAV